MPDRVRQARGDLRPQQQGHAALSDHLLDQAVVGGALGGRRRRGRVRRRRPLLGLASAQSWTDSQLGQADSLPVRVAHGQHAQRSQRRRGAERSSDSAARPAAGTAGAAPARIQFRGQERRMTNFHRILVRRACASASRSSLRAQSIPAGGWRLPPPGLFLHFSPLGHVLLQPGELSHDRADDRIAAAGPSSSAGRRTDQRTPGPAVLVRLLVLAAIVAAAPP